MLTYVPRRGGFTLVELMIGLGIFAILLMFMAPTFASWIQSTQIRNSAESILNGVVAARAESVRLNTSVNFQLVTSSTNSCVLSTLGTSWVVSRDDPTSKCASSPSDTVAPRIIQKRFANDGSPNAVVTADQNTITFNGYGQATNLGAATASINVTNPTGGTCVASGGPMRCLRVEVTTGGQVRMCDPALASTDPRGC